MEKIGHLLVVGQCLSISSESCVQEGVSSRSLDSSYDPGAGLSAADAILHALRRGWDQLSRDTEIRGQTSHGIVGIVVPCDTYSHDAAMQHGMLVSLPHLAWTSVMLLGRQSAGHPRVS